MPIGDSLGSNPVTEPRPLPNNCLWAVEEASEDATKQDRLAVQFIEQSDFSKETVIKFAWAIDRLALQIARRLEQIGAKTRP